jgi:hypothetical protein
MTQATSTEGWVLHSNGAYYAAATATCPSGYVATGGGANCDSAGGIVSLIYSNPVGNNGYYGSCVNLNYGGLTGAGTGNGVATTVYCASQGPAPRSIAIKVWLMRHPPRCGATRVFPFLALSARLRRCRSRAGHMASPQSVNGA